LLLFSVQRPALFVHRLNRLCLLFFLVVVGAQATDRTNTPRWTQGMLDRSPLMVGATTDSYPYSYLDEKGAMRGFSVEITDAVARVMNLAIQRVPAPGRELQQRFQAGEFDLLQSYSQTPERENYAEFSLPFLTLKGAIFIQRKDSPIKRIEDLNGLKFAIIGKGSIGEQFLRDHNIQVIPVYVSSSEEALHLIDRGECAASFISMLTGLSVSEHSDISGAVIFDLPQEDYDIRHCFAVHRGDAVLLARLNEGLAILHQSGEYERIYKHWFGRFDQPLIMRETLVSWGIGILSLGFLAALAAFLRQRTLHRRISRQATELADQQELLHALYDNLPFVVCLMEGVPAKPRVLSLNRQGEPNFGLPARDAAGRLLSELPLEIEWRRHLLDLLKQIPNHAGFVREERGLSSSRKRFVFTLLPLTPGPGGLNRTCLLAEDVTERRALDDEIAQSRKLRAVGELVGGIAHEFNNLLTPILLQTSSIKLDWPNDSRLHEAISIIAGAGQRGAELTRRLLTFGRKTESRIETVRLATIVDQSFALMRLTLDRRIQWQNSVSPSLPPLHLNVTDLNQVLANLILNARDTLLDKLAIHRSGWVPTITIEASEEPPYAMTGLIDKADRDSILGWQRLTVRDNGMGMDASVRERIFEPFYTTKDVGKGTGLGLATVWHVIADCGGRIEVESSRGEGSAFHVWLPMKAPPSTISSEDPAPIRANPSQARIFLADDDELVARTICTALTRSGHAVHRVGDGATAWQRLQAEHTGYDLAILDVNMPGMDGIELAHRLRSRLGFAGKIMIVSGRLGSNDLSELTQAKVDAVLTKPFDMQEFISTVDTCLTGKSRHESPDDLPKG
jgi:two-component system, cell cycle sensor histidine kinase and response regulator CckA